MLPEHARDTYESEQREAYYGTATDDLTYHWNGNETYERKVAKTADDAEEHQAEYPAEKYTYPSYS